MEGFATLEQTINTATEQGGTFDLSPVLEDQVASAMRTVKIVNDKDLKVIDAIRTRTDRSAKIRWTMVTPAAPAVENDRIVLTSNGKTMYLTAAEEGGTQIVYKTFSTDPVHSYDDPNPGIYLVRIRGDRARGQMGDLHHDALTRKLIPAAEKPFSPSGPGRRRRLFGVPGVRNPPKTPPRLSVRPPQKRRFRNIVNEKNINLYKDILLTHS